MGKGVWVGRADCVSNIISLENKRNELFLLVRKEEKMLEFCAIETLWLLKSYWDVREWLAEAIVECRPIASGYDHTIVRIRGNAYVFGECFVGYDGDLSLVTINVDEKEVKLPFTPVRVTASACNSYCIAPDSSIWMLDGASSNDGIFKLTGYTARDVCTVGFNIIYVNNNGQVTHRYYHEKLEFPIDSLEKVKRCTTGPRSFGDTGKSDVWTAVLTDQADIFISYFAHLETWFPIEGKFIDISCGREHIIALHRNGTVWGMGISAKGRMRRIYPLGDFPTPEDEEEWYYDSDTEQGESHSPIQIQLPSKAIAIASGAFHCAIVLEDGRVQCMGSNRLHQLGSEDVKAISYIMELPDPVIAVSCGKEFTVALTVKGGVYGWGENRRGQMGINDHLEPTDLIEIVSPK